MGHRRQGGGRAGGRRQQHAGGWLLSWTGDADSVRRARAAFDAILQAAIEAGGTTTGEHGVGRAEVAALADQVGPDVLDLARRVRAAVDPLGITDPGVL